MQTNVAHARGSFSFTSPSFFYPLAVMGKPPNCKFESDNTDSPSSLIQRTSKASAALSRVLTP